MKQKLTEVVNVNKLDASESLEVIKKPKNDEFIEVCTKVRLHEYNTSARIQGAQVVSSASKQEYVREGYALDSLTVFSFKNPSYEPVAIFSITKLQKLIFTETYLHSNGRGTFANTEDVGYSTDSAHPNSVWRESLALFCNNNKMMILLIVYLTISLFHSETSSNDHYEYGPNRKSARHGNMDATLLLEQPIAAKPKQRGFDDNKRRVVHVGGAVLFHLGAKPIYSAKILYGRAQDVAPVEYLPTLRDQTWKVV